MIPLWDRSRKNNGLVPIEPPAFQLLPGIPKAGKTLFSLGGGIPVPAFPEQELGAFGSSKISHSLLCARIFGIFPASCWEEAEKREKDS